MTKTAQALVTNAISLNASVHLDDVVNVFVSQHEDALLARQKEIQQGIKQLRKEQSDLLASFAEQAEAKIKEWVAILSGGAKYKKADKRYYDNSERVIFDITQKIDLPAPIVSAYGDDDNAFEEHEFAVTVPFSVEQLAELETIKVSIAEANNKLVLINTELMQIDRKTRQIKAIIARQKLEESGNSDLLASPEIQKILQLSSDI